MKTATISMFLGVFFAIGGIALQTVMLFAATGSFSEVITLSGYGHFMNVWEAYGIMAFSPAVLIIGGVLTAVISAYKRW